MLNIKGIRQRQYEYYGVPFLQTIQAWRKKHPELKAKINIASSSSPTPKSRHNDRPSHLVSYRLFQSGKPIRDIAAIREITEQTVENHLFQSYKTGYPIAWEIFFRSEEHTSELQSR